MKICIIGKFPPIQGGVSMRTYHTAHALAARGHEVHVVTNAKEVQPPFRMHMRPEDWARCEGRHQAGSVTVHWTDPMDRSQNTIPMANPFVSKLAAIAARAHGQRRFDLIYSHYLEPYGVAAHLAAQMTGAPHVARMAGSDAGRLWHHPQFELLYDHVLRSAERVIAGGKVAARAVERGVAPERIAYGGGFAVPDDLFIPEGPRLDLATLRAELETDSEIGDVTWGEFAGDCPHFGICGKLGDNKGSFALLEAMQRLKEAKLDIGLVALAHGPPEIERRFRALAQKLGLAERVLQIPFLPHWRVPEFLRGCLAVCCLEQDFPIVFHTPIIPLEVLLCGSCLVGSTEVIRKLPNYGQLVDGYGCVAIEDVNDIDALTDKLAAIVEDPTPVAAVGARGRSFARMLQEQADFPQLLESTLLAAAERKPGPTPKGSERLSPQSEDDQFPLTRLAETTISESTQASAESRHPPAAERVDLPRARHILDAMQRAVRRGQEDLVTLAAGVQIEVLIAEAQNEADAGPLEGPDPLFRLSAPIWAINDGDIAELTVLRDPRLRVLKFDYDVCDFRGARAFGDLPQLLTRTRSQMVVFGTNGGQRPDPVVIDEITAEILYLSDGTRTAREIAEEVTDQGRGPSKIANLKWLESLFVQGFVSLSHTPGKVR